MDQRIGIFWQMLFLSKLLDTSIGARPSGFCSCFMVHAVVFFMRAYRSINLLHEHAPGVCIHHEIVHQPHSKNLPLFHVHDVTVSIISLSAGVVDIQDKVVNGVIWMKITLELCHFRSQLDRYHFCIYFFAVFSAHTGCPW